MQERQLTVALGAWLTSWQRPGLVALVVAGVHCLFLFDALDMQRSDIAQRDLPSGCAPLRSCDSVLFRVNGDFGSFGCKQRVEIALSLLHALENEIT
jgi:hypothetical protein